MGSWCFADDTGRLPADPRILKSQILPYDDRVTVKKVQKLIGELVDAGKYIPYEVNGVGYLLAPNFLTHQKINRPQGAKYPPPPLKESSSVSGADSVNGQGASTTDTTHTRRDSTPSSAADEDDGALRTHLEAKGFDPKDVATVVERFQARLRFGGEPIKDPEAWATTVLTKMAKAHPNGSRQPAIVDLGDGFFVEQTEDGSWRELEEVPA